MASLCQSASSEISILNYSCLPYKVLISDSAHTQPVYRSSSFAHLSPSLLCKISPSFRKHTEAIKRERCHGSWFNLENRLGGIARSAVRRTPGKRERIWCSRGSPGKRNVPSPHCAAAPLVPFCAGGRGLHVTESILHVPWTKCTGR